LKFKDINEAFNKFLTNLAEQRRRLLKETID